MLLEQRPQGEMLRTRSGPGQELVHAGLRDLAAGGKIGLMPHDATPACGIAKQLPAVAVGAAVEIVNRGQSSVWPPVCVPAEASAAMFCLRRAIVATRSAVATTAAGANSSRAENGARFRPKGPARSRRKSRAPPGSPVVVS